jgi:hypothetical protein
VSVGLRHVALLAAGAAVLAGCSAAPIATPPRATTTTAKTVVTRHRHGHPTPRPHPPGPPPGALGSRPAWEACDLLSRAQIRAQFGGRVGQPTPVYPYCQWLIGSDAFLALEIEPHTSFATATQYVAPLEQISGLGSKAMIANNRYLYFAKGSTSYWLLWQQVGDFSTLNAVQLTSLGHDVLNAVAAGHVPRPPQRVAAGPAIYFAGDSTAAGPEWAWVNYFATRATPTLCEYQVGSDLEVPGYFDWTRHLQAMVLARRPRLVVYMGSANDGQPLFYKGAFQQPGSAGWRAAYGALMAAMMRGVAGTGTRLLVIGEPAMQNPSLSAAMAAMDEVDAAEARQFKGVYFYDPGSVLNGPGGSYEGSLVIDGKPTPVRLDGIHLNIAGSLYLARYIAKLITTLLPPR